MDHSTIEYKSFEKKFYEEHPDIAGLSDEQVNALLQTLGLKVLNYAYREVSYEQVGEV